MPVRTRYTTPIRFYNRATGKIQIEDVYGERFLLWAYSNFLGRLTVALAFKRLWFSGWYGWRMNQSKSCKKIRPFIQNYSIDIEEFQDSVDSFKNFNQFFYRKLKPGARPIHPDSKVAVFPADGRHLAVGNVDTVNRLYVKNQSFDLVAFLDDPSLAHRFKGGSALISRLCPVDYHRYHFPVSGVAGKVRMLKGALRSVSPIALRRRLSILWENRRARTILKSPDFGTVVLIEVGATCVGGIHETYQPGFVKKGAEKGYFSFGGSCLVTLFQKGAIRFDPDLIEQAAQGREVYAKMGECMGVRRGSYRPLQGSNGGFKMDAVA